MHEVPLQVIRLEGMVLGLRHGICGTPVGFKFVLAADSACALRRWAMEWNRVAVHHAVSLYEACILLWRVVYS